MLGMFLLASTPVSFSDTAATSPPPLPVIKQKAYIPAKALDPVVPEGPKAPWVGFDYTPTNNTTTAYIYRTYDLLTFEAPIEYPIPGNWAVVTNWLMFTNGSVITSNQLINVYPPATSFELEFPMEDKAFFKVSVSNEAGVFWIP